MRQVQYLLMIHRHLPGHWLISIKLFIMNRNELKNVNKIESSCSPAHYNYGIHLYQDGVLFSCNAITDLNTISLTFEIEWNELY